MGFSLSEKGTLNMKREKIRISPVIHHMSLWRFYIYVICNIR